MWWKREQYRSPKIYSLTPKQEKESGFSPKLIWWIVLFILIGFLVWFFFFSSYFKIKNIEIDGSLNPEVKSAIDQFYNKNILTFQPGKIEEDLIKKQTSIKSIEIRRGLPDTLKIKVNVREPVIGWKSQEKTYLVDENGIVFELGEGEVVTEEGKEIPVIEDSQNIAVEPGSQIVTADFVDFVKNFVEQLKEEQEIKVTALKIVETTFQIEADTDQGWKIIVNTIASLTNQLKALAKVLETKREEVHEYIDLRIEGRVYYK